MAVAQNGEMSAAGSVLFLTVLGTVSQVLGFGYRVALSRMVGAEVMGLYQLLMPVYSVLLSLTAVGLTAAASNLTSQHLALGNGRGAAQVLGTCGSWPWSFFQWAGRRCWALTPSPSICWGMPGRSWGWCCWSPVRP